MRAIIFKSLSSFGTCKPFKRITVSKFSVEMKSGFNDIPLQMKTLIKSRRSVIKHLDEWTSLIASSSEVWPPADILLVIKSISLIQSPKRLQLLPPLAASIFAASATFTAEQVSSALYSLGVIGLEHQETRNFMKVVMKLSEKNPAIWTPDGVSKITYGMRQFKQCGDQEVQDTILLIAQYLNNTKYTWFPSHIAKLMSGINNFGYDENCTTFVILQEMKIKILECKEAWSIENIADCCYGLRSMSNNHPEVQSIQSLLVEKLKIVKATWPISIANSARIINSFRSMNSNHPEVLEMISLLIPDIRDYSRPIAGLEFSNILYGLRGMSSEPLVIRQLLKVLIPKILDSDILFNAQELRDARHGLGSMNDNHCEVENMLIILGKANL